jgi:hypothetical protein
MVESTGANVVAAGMPYLYIFNWTPWSLYVNLNGWDDPKNPLKPSVAANTYFPYFDNHYPRDLSLDNGTSTAWGHCNQLIVNFAEVSQRLQYSNIEDPIATISADLYLWVFVDSVVFSQQNSMLKEVEPD